MSEKGREERKDEKAGEAHPRAGCCLMTAVRSLCAAPARRDSLRVFTDMHYLGVNHHGRSDKEVIYLYVSSNSSFPIGQNSTHRNEHLHSLLG